LPTARLFPVPFAGDPYVAVRSVDVVNVMPAIPTISLRYQEHKINALFDSQELGVVFVVTIADHQHPAYLFEL